MLQLKFNLQKVQFLLIETATIPCKRKKLHYAKQNQELASDKYLLLPKQAKINQLNLLKKSKNLKHFINKNRTKKNKTNKIQPTKSPSQLIETTTIPCRRKNYTTPNKIKNLHNT